MPLMKKAMMRGLLLVAVLGYFFAELHTTRHLHIPGHAEVSSHHTAPPPSDSSKSSAEDTDDCLICTVHSHTVATVPPLDLPCDTPIVKTPAPRQHTGSLYPTCYTRTLGARAPPIL